MGYEKALTTAGTASTAKDQDIYRHFPGAGRVDSDCSFFAVSAVLAVVRRVFYE
jgi:hypothetical protein